MHYLILSAYPNKHKLEAVVDMLIARGFSSSNFGVMCRASTLRQNGTTPPTNLDEQNSPVQGISHYAIRHFSEIGLVFTGGLCKEVGGAYALMSTMGLCQADANRLLHLLSVGACIMTVKCPSHLVEMTTDVLTYHLPYQSNTVQMTPTDVVFTDVVEPPTDVNHDLRLSDHQPHLIVPDRS